MWEVTYTITPQRGYIDRGERVLQEADIRLRAVHYMEVLSDDSVVLVYDIDSEVDVLRQTLEASEGKVIEYAITNQADPLMAQLRVRPDDTFQKLLDIHRSYGVSVNFPITYLNHDPVTIEMVEMGPKTSSGVALTQPATSRRFGSSNSTAMNRRPESSTRN